MPYRVVLRIDEIAFATSLINSQPMTSKDLHRAAVKAADDFERGSNSLQLLCARLHLAIHKCLPTGTTHSEEWYTVSSVIATFLAEYGVDAYTNINIARQQVGLPTNKIKHSIALNIFLTYAKNLKASITDMQWGTLRIHRETIVHHIEHGTPVTEAVQEIVAH